MFIKTEKKINKKGESRTYIRIVESYTDKGHNKHRSIKNYGYLEDQINKEVFLQFIEEELKKFKNEKGTPVKITLSSDDNKLNGSCNIAYNYGYKYLESIYDFLGIDKFLNSYQNSLTSKERYDISKIFKLLVFERILSPDSKRATLQKSRYYYEADFNFSLDDVYRSLDLLEPIYKELQIHMRKKLEVLFSNKDSLIYYDVTNYYCCIDFNDLADGLRKKGVSKEHRLDPIIGLGLFMDSNGIPLSFQIFPGNQAETTTLIPGIDEIKKTNDISRVICVADKGLNSKKNITKLVENKDGYLFSQVLRGSKGMNYKKRLFDDSSYIHTYNEDGELIYKYQIYEEDIILKDSNDKPFIHKQKILIYWNKEESIMQKRKRDEQVEKASKSLKNNAYQLDHSYRKYIMKEKNKNIGIDYDKVNEDAKYDGYFCLVTSELNMKHNEMRKTYHQLWEIEETFKITKTNLEFRPIYHYKYEHIISHFLICFTSLLILRLFQYKLKQNGVSLSVERIVTVLDKMKVEMTSKDYVQCQ